MIRTALVFVVLLGLAACETTKGFVRDSENVGDALTQ